MKIILSAICVVVAAFSGGYMCGRSQAKTQIVEREVEVIKYVAQKRAKVQAQPNADRTELIELMRKGKL